MVRARGRCSIFEAQGKFQLYVDALEPAGLGALQLAFEQLKKKLAAEGLFDVNAQAAAAGLAAAHRRRHVTDGRGGARHPAHRASGVGACAFSSRRARCRATARRSRSSARFVASSATSTSMIVARGGGSAEDLAAFNDESLARAIAGCTVPVVSAVGHEVDFTIADFVADVRAPTPSGAAELVVPSFAEQGRRLEECTKRLVRDG